MSLRHDRYLRDRFCAIGVSRSLAADLETEVSRYVTCSGQEWTVNRLKLLKSAFMKRIAGETYHLPYVAKRRDALGDVPKGPFGVLWHHCDVSDITSISRVLNCMMVYSTFVATAVTSTQKKKFFHSMTRDAPPQVALDAITDSLYIPKWMYVERSTRLTTIEEFVVSHGYTVSYFNKALYSFVEEGDTGMALWEEFPQFKEVFNTIASGVNSRFAFDDYFGIHPELNSATTRSPIGRLGLTQEPGYKLRVFADPNIIYQAVMSRLKAQLFNLLRKVKWDCTFDQSVGTDWVQVQLNQGKKIWSVDLSDATNNFPLDIQLKVLRAIGCDPADVDLFHRLARAPWSHDLGETRTTRWTVGQPLGLGPSFAAFALTHGVLVNTLAREDSVLDGFRILGDDIVISDERLATRYREVMQVMGVPISADKTISSVHFAEFAGKVISPKGVIAALKWKEPSDRSFLDVVRLLGPRSLDLLPRRQRAVADFISVLPEPHGFGWNPKGIPLAKRVELAQAFAELVPEKERTFRPFQTLWSKYALRLELPYLKMSFTALFPESYVGTTCLTAVDRRWTPTPVGSWKHLLSVSEMTGAPLRLPDHELTGPVLREIAKRGYRTLTSSTDPRGLNPLEGLEMKLTKLQRVLDYDYLDVIGRK